MSNRSSYFRLGLFMVGALLAGVIILVVLGVGNMFRPKLVLETYFDGTVQGLDVGAPVKLRGVSIGEVSYIGFTRGRYELDVLPVERRQYVLVEAVIRPDRLSATGRAPSPEVIDAMVSRGLRVRMTAQGVTGINFLELDFLDPAENPPIPIDWMPENLYVPSAPGTVTQFIQYAESLARRLDRLDVESLLDNSNRLLETLDRSVASLDVPRINTDIVLLLERLGTTLGRVDTMLSSPALADMPENLGVAAANLRALSESPRFDESMDSLERTLARLERTAEGVEDAVQGYEHNLSQTLDNLRAFSEQLRVLTEEAGQHPGLIWSEPPAPVEIPQP